MIGIQLRRHLDGTYSVEAIRSGETLPVKIDDQNLAADQPFASITEAFARVLWAAVNFDVGRITTFYLKQEDRDAFDPMASEAGLQFSHLAQKVRPPE